MWLIYLYFQKKEVGQIFSKSKICISNNHLLFASLLKQPTEHFAQSDTELPNFYMGRRGIPVLLGFKSWLPDKGSRYGKERDPELPPQVDTPKLNRYRITTLWEGPEYSAEQLFYSYGYKEKTHWDRQEQDSHSRRWPTRRRESQMQRLAFRRRRLSPTVGTPGSNGDSPGRQASISTSGFETSKCFHLEEPEGVMENENLL